MQLVNSHTYINGDYNIDLLQMHKNNWKSAINDEEYEHINVDFKSYQKIFSDGIHNAKHQYYFNTLISHKNDIKKPIKTDRRNFNQCILSKYWSKIKYR